MTVSEIAVPHGVIKLAHHWGLCNNCPRKMRFSLVWAVLLQSEPATLSGERADFQKISPNGRVSDQGPLISIKVVFHLDIIRRKALKRGARFTPLQVPRWITANFSAPLSIACMTSGVTGFLPTWNVSRAAFHMRCGIPRKAPAMS